MGREPSLPSTGCWPPCPGAQPHGALPGGGGRGAPGGPCPSMPAPPRSLCDHRDFLPVLLHGPLQLSVTIGPEAAIWQMQVGPRGRPLPRPAPTLCSPQLRWPPVSWFLKLQALLGRCRGRPPCPVAPVWHGVGRHPTLAQCWRGLPASGAGQSGDVGGGSLASLSPHPVPAQAQWGQRGCLLVPGRGGRAGPCGRRCCWSRPGRGRGAHLPGAWSGSEQAGGPPLKGLDEDG